MKLVHPASGQITHLGYCSNIHAGETWQEVQDNLQRYVPGIREALAPGEPFGIGLRLSAEAARELNTPDAIDAFQSFLQENALYVFTLNGFPYGRFHGTQVKEDVYLPDWMDAERLRYTNELADIFVRLLADGEHGSISTVPGAFKQRVRGEEDVRCMERHLLQQVAYLVKLQRSSGRHITLALEPEPCCFLETIDECVDFFCKYIHSDDAASFLAESVSTTLDDAHRLLREHLTLCLDLCHAAVEFENADSCLQKLADAGIRIGKLQISSGLRLPDVTAATVNRLDPYIDNVYLHQVVQKHNGKLTRFIDLPEAIAQLEQSGKRREWRVHFHVPVFMDDLEAFSSTQFFIRDMLERHRQTAISDHLEIETYTWDVLPEALRSLSVDQAIIREMQWVRNALV